MPVSRKRKRPGTAKGAAKNGSRSGSNHLQFIERFRAGIDRPNDEHDLRKAQDIVFDACEARTPAKRIALVKKALSISPLCADAWTILAEEAAKTPEEV